MLIKRFMVPATMLFSMRAFYGALKEILTKEEYEGLNEALQEHYQADGESYILTTDKGTKAKLDEFRKNNIDLKKALEDAKAEAVKYKDLDPEKAREALKKVQELQDKQTLDEKGIDELLAQRTERMRADHDAQTKALNEALAKEKDASAKANKQLERILIDNQATVAAGKVGTLAKGALDDLLSRARNEWHLQDGKPVCLNAAGEPRYGKNAQAPMSFDEWAEEQIEKAPHLFANTTGGDAGGSESKSTPAGKPINVRSDQGKREFSQSLEDIASGKRQATMS